MDLNKDSEFRFFDQIKSIASKQEIAAKTVLLQEGEISKRIYFIEKGCLRLWFNNQGKDVSFQFFFEGEAVSSVESFWLNQPSSFSIEAIELTTLLVVDKLKFKSLIEESDENKRRMEAHLLKRLFSYQKLFLSRIKESPQERYQMLLDENPKILQRIPQHYIASYLGITPVSLSRIRNRE